MRADCHGLMGIISMSFLQSDQLTMLRDKQICFIPCWVCDCFCCVLVFFAVFRPRHKTDMIIIPSSPCPVRSSVAYWSAEPNREVSTLCKEKWKELCLWKKNTKISYTWMQQKATLKFCLDLFVVCSSWVPSLRFDWLWHLNFNFVHTPEHSTIYRN